MERDQVAEVEGGEHVAVAHDEALVEPLGGEADRAGGTERVVLHRVAQHEVAEAALGEVRLERVGQVAERQHDLVDAVARQPRELALEERLVGDRQQRLGRGVGERAQPRALAADEDDRLHGVRARSRRECWWPRAGRAGNVVVVASIATHGEFLLRFAVELSVIWLNAVHAFGGNG